MFYSSIGVSILFLGLTGLFLIMDLDRPDRFLNVLLRPHWGSWLVKGGYSITAFGGLLTLLAVSKFFDWSLLFSSLMWLTGVISVVVAIYTAFLFGQAKGRDFWQSPTLSIHMLVHSFMAGSAVFMLGSMALDFGAGWLQLLNLTMLIAIGVNLITMLFEMTTTHPTKDAKTTVHMILQGRYSRLFWAGVVLVGNVVPVILLIAMPSNLLLAGFAGALVLLGIYLTEHIWVEAPQRIALS
jgi:formate-dependent nitrite reductase membrane component NrfD